MSNRNMALDVIVRLKDLLTGPLRRLRSSLDGISSAARKIGLVSTAIAAISFMGPIKEAAAFQQQLLDIAGTSNLTGQAAFDLVEKSKSQYEALALQVGQYSDTIAKGAGQMIAASVDPKLVDGSIRSIGRAATAANAEFSDMAGVATSLLQTLRLPADQLDAALGGLVVAGKEGAFELKDMARYFPTLTSQMAKFGVTGREAVNFLGAALQIARKGTADPAEAANNLKNFLSKILAPATIKNFAEAGVDIEAVMKDAATKGINPIEAVVQKISQLTGVSGKEIEGLMKKAKANGLEGAEALASVREQLQQIYGAGKLGEIFGDMQVMDFLIPMLSNIDEYKRIKEEVAKATGAMIDGDFETQMQGLNRQLITFGEIGTQASREVGFAFGSWLPMINENLSALLLWLRETDKATGGMVRKMLSFAGAGVLVAAGIGALGFILPAIGAGLSALAALMGPVGIALAAIGAGAYTIYKNWGTYGPQLTRLWDRAKDTYSRFAEGVAEKGGRIIAAGREMADRYGPTIRAGLMSAWTDIKAGFQNLKGLFDGFMKGLDLKIDFSGLTIDNAKLASFRALELAMAGISAAWNTLKDFGSGFAPYLSSIGENMGGSVKAIGEIASGMLRLARALTTLVGLDLSKAEGFSKWLGGFAGGAIEVATFTLRTFYEALAKLVGTLADLAEGKISWESLIPKGLADAWNDGAQALGDFIAAVKALPGDFYNAGVEAGQRLMDGIKGKIDELVEWFKSLPSRITGAISNIDLSGLISWPSMPSWLGGGSVSGANDNSPNPIAAAQSPVPAQASPQQLNVNSTATVKVEGPGRVVEENTTVSSPSANVNTGRVLGRN